MGTIRTTGMAIASMVFVSAATAEVPGCELLMPISTDQARELRDTMIAEGADELDIIDAYETLKCAERESYRTLATTSALKSESAALQTQIVGGLFLSKEVIVFELTADETANPLALKSVTDNPTFTANVDKVELDKNLLKFEFGYACNERISYDSLAIDVNLGCNEGRRIAGRLTFNNGAFSGTLRLSVDGKALGAINGRVGLIQ